MPEREISFYGNDYTNTKKHEVLFQTKNHLYAETEDAFLDIVAG